MGSSSRFQLLSELSASPVNPDDTGTQPPEATIARNITPAASVGGVPELLHIHVHERPGVVMLVTADMFTCGAVYVCESVRPSS